MGEAQADVKGAVLFTQAEQSEDVHKVLIPPKYHTSQKEQIKQHTFHLYVCILALTHNTPQNLLTSRGQVAVNKPKRCSIEEKGDTDSSLVSWGQRENTATELKLIKNHSWIIFKSTYPKCFQGPSSRWLCSHDWCGPHVRASQTQPGAYSRGTALPPTGQ